MKNRHSFTGRRALPALALLLTLLPRPADAKYIGADPARRDPTCCTCAAAGGCALPRMQERYDSGTTISRSQGNLTERLNLAGISGGVGAGIPFDAVYNTYNADGSRAQVDTVMGYGWTHSYNIFLFDQLGAKFRYDGEGYVTRYAINAAGGFTAQSGVFETLVKNPDGSFTLTQKDQTSYHFATIPNTPFLVGGPVWMLTGITDRNGNTTTLTYTGGLLTGIANAYGRSLALSYNSQNHLASVTDPLGRVTTFHYDSTGRNLASVTDANGAQIQYTYNVLHQLTGKVDRAGRTFTYSYNSSFEPVTVLDSAGSTTASLSNPNNWATNASSLALVQMRVYLASTATGTDGRGNTWRYPYNTNGYLTQIVAPDGATTNYAYDAATLMPSSMTDANGHATTYTYDVQGNLLSRTDAMGHTTTYTYEPSFNMMTRMTDARGRITTYGYDSRGNRVLETDPLGQTRSWTYDAHGNPLSYTDQNGHTTTYQYDVFSNLVKTIDPLNDVTTMTYDLDGNLLSTTDANLHTTAYQYDGLNRLTVQIDATGHRTQTVYDGEGNRIQVIDRNTNPTSYQYDLRQRLIKMIDAVGHFESYTYDLNDNRISSTDRNNHATSYQYDVQNRVTRVTDALGGTTSMSYDAAGNLTAATDANGHTSTNTYDALNRRSTMTDALGEETLYFYDTGTFTGAVTLGGVSVTCNQCGATPGSTLVTAQVDPDGTANKHAGTTYFKYDALNRMVILDQRTGCIGGPSGTGCADTISAATDALTLYTYDPAGNRLTWTEPDGNTTTDQYDAANRRTQQTNAAGDVMKTAYDPVGNIVTVTAANQNATTYSYDALNRRIQISDSIGSAGAYTYDPNGNLLSQTDGNGNTAFDVYDALNRLVTQTDPLGIPSQFQYDPAGNLLKGIDRNGNPTTWTYDAINRLVTTTDALGNVTQRQYDAVGNLVKLTDANSHATQYFYDAVNRLMQETYPDLGSDSRFFTYDPVGKLLTRTDQAGRITNLTYNDLRFLTGRSYPGGINDAFTYDLSGRVLTAQRGTWLVTFAYDGGDRVTQTTQSGQTIGYTYDIPGRTRQIAYPGGRVVTEHTDARNRLDHIDDGASPPPIVQYSYDLGDRVTNRAYRNGTSASYSYNANNWILNLQHSLGATPIAGFSYAYDNEGNKQFENKLQDGGHSEAYQYDNTYRLITYKVGALVGSTVPAPITQTSYSLDPVGNWNNKTTGGVTQNRVHNAVNELIQIDSTNLTYDSEGNLANDGQYTYLHDEENRLTMVTRNADSAVVGQYQYDAFGRRVQKTADASGSPATTFYFYDNARIVEEQSTLGTTAASYVYGNAVDEILTMARAGQSYYYHQNALGSVAAITDSTGTGAEFYSYDPYGHPSVTSAIGNPWMFAGRYLDEETGIYDYRARYHDPAKGRFLERDPLEPDPNLYEYGRDNPVNVTDPSGAFPVIVSRGFHPLRYQWVNNFDLYDVNVFTGMGVPPLRSADAPLTPVGFGPMSPIGQGGVFIRSNLWLQVLKLYGGCIDCWLPGRVRPFAFSFWEWWPQAPTRGGLAAAKRIPIGYQALTITIDIYPYDTDFHYLSYYKYPPPGGTPCVCGQVTSVVSWTNSSVATIGSAPLSGMFPRGVPGWPPVPATFNKLTERPAGGPLTNGQGSPWGYVVACGPGCGVNAPDCERLDRWGFIGQ
jgi:RHS repeat-associated protein